MCKCARMLSYMAKPLNGTLPLRSEVISAPLIDELLSTMLRFLLTDRGKADRF